MAKLEVGEKYLSIHLFGGEVKLSAFPVKEKNKGTEPDFRGNGVAVWVNTKKEGQPKQESIL